VKNIPLRVLPDPNAPDVQGAEIRSIDVIRNVVRQPKDRQAGASIEEIRRGIHILDALDAANGSLELEDADYAELRDKTMVMPWGMVDKRLLQIIDDILD
jgi:hypothetical protein